MERMVRVGVAVATGLLLLARPTAAQIGASTASIAGVVKDPSGAVLPGVTVEASSPVLIERVRSTVTDDKGQYQIVGLQSGAYSIMFTLAGFSGLKRDGIELSPNFTATVNVELKVGGIEETLTVSGQSPLVDTRNVTSQKVVSKALIDAVPTAKSILSIAALVPAATIPASAQDVGGSKGETTVRMSVHGAKPNDQRQMIDGMSYNSMFAGGTGRGFYANPLEMQDLVIDSGRAGSAEYALGGTMVNSVPRDGGDRFGGTLFTALMGHQLQSNNLTSDLVTRGLRSVNGVRQMHDFNGAAGGPIVHDKLWFFTAQRWNGLTKRTANLFRDANASSPNLPNNFLFKPDLGQPVEPEDRIHSHTVRLTWQATAKDKINVFNDTQRNSADSQGAGLDSGVTAREAVRPFCAQPSVTQGSWTRPQNNRLLFEGGVSFLYSGYYSLGSDLFMSDFTPCGEYQPDKISITDTALSLTYGGEGLRQKAKILLSNMRWSTTYTTGTHNFKTGVSVFYSFHHQLSVDRTHTGIGLPVSYRFNNGVPNQVTEYAGSTLDDYRVRPDLGLFVQDQWRATRRLTLNLGLRYDYIRAYAPPIARDAGPFNDAVNFPQVDCLPCWHDLNPRMSGAYDLFGDGKTVVKAGLNRYVQSTAANLAMTFAPTVSAVNSTTRSWTDRNGNFLPDCDLRNPLLNNECGAMLNSTFGGSRVTTRPDPDWIRGFGKRAYDWQASLSIDRELMPGVAVNAGYYRTWYGNFTVTDNSYTTPADFDPYCITAPTDSRLPGGISGQQICGFYDVKPALFGLVDNVVTLADKFGKQSEVYQGVDVNFAARLPRGAQMSGGWSIGNAINVSNTVLSARTNNCFVVDSPQQLYQCDVRPPYQQRFKVSGSYPLFWDIQAAAVYQNLPGISYSATLTVPTARIAPTLGRNLAGGTANATIQLLAPYSAFFDDRINQLDLRFSKIFRFMSMKKSRLQGNFDIYNALNANTVLSAINAYTVASGTTQNRWLTPTQVLDARLIKFSVQLDF